MKAFTKSIALRWNLKPTKIAGQVRILPEGLEVEVDDHVIREFTDGQGMIMQVLKRKCRSGLLLATEVTKQGVIIVSGNHLRGLAKNE